jgi:protein SCO1/2
MTFALMILLTALPVQLRDVAIEQRLNVQVPLDLQFRDETGKSVPLREYFGKKPVILAPVYYDCPMLCTLTLNGLLRATRAMTLKDYAVVAVSFDPRETSELARHKKQNYRTTDWHFLTGDEAAVRQFMEAIGFHYRFDEDTQQYAHAAGIMVATPEGRLARYFYGVEYSARDLRLALVEASENKIGSPVDAVLLFCFHYDPTTGRYGVAIMRILRLAGIFTVVALGTYLWRGHRHVP